MPANKVISRQEHKVEMAKLTGTIERLNAELSALAAYVITAKMSDRSDPIRAAQLAARIGCLTKREAVQSIRRIHDAVLSATLSDNLQIS